MITRIDVQDKTNTCHDGQSKAHVLLHKYNFLLRKKKKTLATEETEIYLKVSRNRKNSPK